MKNKLNFLLIALICLFVATGTATAHHGTAEFDRTKTSSVTGTVTSFVWSNPHGSIEMDVPDGKGNVERWEGFLSSPNFLARAGWTKNTLKPGDQITVTGNLARHRMYLLRVIKVQLANGQDLSVGEGEN